MKRLREHLTYSNAVSTLCLFLLLSGGAALAAGRLGRGSVGTRQLRKNAVTTRKIRNRAVTGAKLDLATIGSVPAADRAALAAHADSASRADSASHADSATRAASAARADSAADARTLTGMSAAQIAARSKLSCPAGTVPAAGSCFDADQRPAAKLIEALDICGRAGMALPGAGEIAAFMIARPDLGDTDNWASSYYLDETFRAPYLHSAGAGSVSIGTSVITTPRPFRCTTQPTN